MKRERKLSKHTDPNLEQVYKFYMDASASMQARRQGSHGGEGMARGCEGEKGHFSLMQVVMFEVRLSFDPR